MSQLYMPVPERLPNYTLETPAHLRYMLATGWGSGIAGLLLAVRRPRQPWVAGLLLATGVVSTGLSTLLHLVTSDKARLSARRKMLDTITWRGDETVLDVGCGNGFLLLEIAKHLTTGKAIGIDVWQAGAGGQTTDAVWSNARIEGVSDKIEVQNVDARRMPYQHATFDLIVSSLALHHMGGIADRQQALQEMVRVLKPGGVILLYDLSPMISQATAVLRRSGLNQVTRLGGRVLAVLSAS